MEHRRLPPFTTNRHERQILKMIFLSAALPIIVVAGFYYALFNDLITMYLRYDLASHFLRQFFILTIVVFFSYFILLGLFSYKIVHRFVGAYPRVLKELNEAIEQRSKKRITLRKGDYARELIDLINKLIDQLP